MSQVFFFENEHQVEVILDLSLQAVDVDEMKKKTSTFVWLSLSWSDSYLGWNTSEVCRLEIFLEVLFYKLSLNFF